MRVAVDALYYQVGWAAMNSLLQKRLDLILEVETTQIDVDAYRAATDVATDLEQARRRVSDLERQLLYAIDRLCGGLAVGVRKHQPGLNVGLEGGRCRIGYKTKQLTVAPDLSKRMWVVQSTDPRFARRFLRGHRTHTTLNNDLMPLAKAVADFFTGHYLSLGEAIEGRGLILLGGHHVSLGDLVDHVRHCDRLINEGGS